MIRTIKEAKISLENKSVSKKELVDAAVENIEKHDNSIHAFISKTYNNVTNLEDELGFLSGIPTCVKDNYNMVETTTTASSAILKSYLSPYDATVIRKLKENDVTILGKTNMDAFAHGSSTETSDFFTTLNPYDLERVAGGSSGGSAAAVAAGMSIYSIGSETAGSVRGPASWCGLVGFVPTYGRISRYGIIAMGSSLDRPGIFTNSVEDAGTVLEILSGEDTLDSTTIPEKPLDIKFDLGKKYKIGIVKQYMDERINSNVRNQVSEICKNLEKEGHTIVEIDLLDPKYSIAVYTIVCRSEVSSNLARIDGIRYGHYSDVEAESVLDQISQNRGEGFGNEAKQRSMTGAYTLSAGYFDAYYKKAQKVRTLIIEDFIKAYEKVDLLVSPTMPDVAPKLGVTDDNPLFGELADVLAEPSALAGLPCMSVPIGFKENLPVGMQIIGKQKDENSVLNLGLQIEKIVNTIFTPKL